MKMDAKLMKRFVEGGCRGQTTLMPECLDDYVPIPIHRLQINIAVSTIAPKQGYIKLNQIT
jgi:hypothetical protein